MDPAEHELTLIILANIHYAKKQEWGQEFCTAMSAIWKKYSYDHVHDATLMAYILKELADADELQATKLAPAPSINKANAVGKYRSILRSAHNSWSNAESSYADSTCEDESSQEECLKLANRHHCN